MAGYQLVLSDLEISIRFFPHGLMVVWYVWIVSFFLFREYNKLVERAVL
jgi:hypothetical protein